MSHATDALEPYRKFEAKIQRIMDMFPREIKPMPRQDHAMAQALLGDLKDDLAEECKRYDFSELEHITFEPAIKQVQAFLTIRRNSRPDDKGIQLYDALSTVRLSSDSLERMIADRSRGEQTDE